jgi:hypothetical protein
MKPNGKNGTQHTERPPAKDEASSIKTDLKLTAEEASVFLALTKRPAQVPPGLRDALARKRK